MKKKAVLVIGVLIVFVLAVVVLRQYKDTIFKSEEQPESTTAAKKTTMSDDVFYVKDGTNFYATYTPGRSFSTTGTNPDAQTRYAFATESEVDLIPTMYKNEFIAYKTTQTVPTSFELERFKEIGYSLGFSGAKLNDTETYDITISSGVYKSSDAKTQLQDLISTSTISLKDINEKQLTVSDISRNGSILGLQKGKAYKVGMYVGSVYGTFNIQADTDFFQSSEVFHLSSFELTTNGYLAIQLPDNLETGYYFIQGVGMFRYINESKVTASDIETYDYNVKNGNADAYCIDDTLESTQNDQTFELTENYTDITVSFHNDSTQMIKSAIIRKPDGSEEEMKSDGNELSTYTYKIEKPAKGTYHLILDGFNVEKITHDIQKGTVIVEETPQSDQTAQEQQQTAITSSTTPDGETPTETIQQPSDSEELTETQQSGTLAE